MEGTANKSKTSMIHGLKEISFFISSFRISLSSLGSWNIRLSANNSDPANMTIGVHHFNNAFDGPSHYCL